jgi:hypothetical protein
MSFIWSGWLRLWWEESVWIFTAPNMTLLMLRGVDKDSRDQIFQRWLDRHPNVKSNG